MDANRDARVRVSHVRKIPPWKIPITVLIIDTIRRCVSTRLWRMYACASVCVNVCMGADHCLVCVCVVEKRIFLIRNIIQCNARKFARVFLVRTPYVIIGRTNSPFSLSLSVCSCFSFFSSTSLVLGVGRSRSKLRLALRSYDMPLFKVAHPFCNVFPTGYILRRLRLRSNVLYNMKVIFNIHIYTF